jgi:hypothetical protein
MRQFTESYSNLLISIRFMPGHRHRVQTKFQKNCVDVLHKNDLSWFILPGVKKFGINVAIRLYNISKLNHSRGDLEFDPTHQHPSQTEAAPRSGAPLLCRVIRSY